MKCLISSSSRDDDDMRARAFRVEACSEYERFFSKYALKTPHTCTHPKRKKLRGIHKLSLLHVHRDVASSRRLVLARVDFVPEQQTNEKKKNKAMFSFHRMRFFIKRPIDRRRVQNTILSRRDAPERRRDPVTRAVHDRDHPVRKPRGRVIAIDALHRG
jgi:hypothetical protein